MKKQKKIANWLKGLCIMLAAAVLAVYGGCIWFHLNVQTGKTSPLLRIAFAGGIALLLLAAIREFWKVCSEIGSENSFSNENAQSFHRIAILAVTGTAAYLIRLVYCIAAGVQGVFPYAYCTGMILAGATIVILCEALSQLIRNAYEIKLENELTI